ncbi:MAG: 16S rRNA (cytidine(1402)-2'-O)-methyltransferase [Pseudomonadota bacterium]
MSSHDPSSPDRGIPVADPSQLRVETQHSLEAGLYIVSTPIGNLRDITLRALDILASADEILAEDTRKTRRLLDAYGLKSRITPYHDHNGAERRPDILKKLQDGGRLALVSDAGTPLLSDPGYKLVRAVLDGGYKVIPIPGASALLAGLVSAGLPSDRFLFAGFLPQKTGARQSALKSLASVDATLIFYESPRRLEATLTDMANVFGPDRACVVARELTKLFEETRSGSLGELADHYKDAGAPKGEVVLLVAPPEGGDVLSEAELDDALKAAMADLPLKKAAAQLAEELGLSKRDLYQRGLALKDSS